jgi:hypothetical protein
MRICVFARCGACVTRVQVQGIVVDEIGVRHERAGKLHMNGS